MATFQGVNAAKRLSIPADLEKQGQSRGMVLSAYDTYELVADLSSGDIIRMCRIPQGARIVDVQLFFDDLDTAGGTLDVGWAAGASGAEAADDNGFLAAVDVTSAGVASMFASQSQNPGYQKVFAEEVELQVKVNGDTDAVTGTVSVEVHYVID